MGTPIKSVQCYEVFRSKQFPAVEYRIICSHNPVYSVDTRAAMLGDAVEYVEAYLLERHRSILSGGDKLDTDNRFWFDPDAPEGTCAFRPSVEIK